MKRLLFIYNPQAGKGTVKAHLSNIVDTFTKAGYLVTIWPTQGKEDATHVAAQQGWWYDRVVCCGGDGTLSETVSGLLALDTPPVLGYIPAGTTNDFSKNLGLPRGVEKAAVTAVEGEARPCDMGRFNGRYFVYVAAFGIFTDVSYGTPQQFKNAFGHLAYVLEGATKLGDLGRAYHLQVEHDEGSLEGDFIYGMVTNTLSVGGFKVFPPQAGLPGRRALRGGAGAPAPERGRPPGRPVLPGAAGRQQQPSGGGLPHQEAEGDRRRAPPLDPGRGVRGRSGDRRHREPARRHHPGVGEVSPTPPKGPGSPRWRGPGPSSYRPTAPAGP